MGYIKSFVRRQDVAEDIFQEICVLALQKREEITDELHLKKWMRTTARFHALNSNRKRHEAHQTLDEDVANLMDRCWQQNDAIDESRLAEALSGCMSALSSVHRALLEKRFIANLDYNQLAKEMDRSTNSLYTTFSRIYASLAQCISEKLKTPVKS